MVKYKDQKTIWLNIFLKENNNRVFITFFKIVLFENILPI